MDLGEEQIGSGGWTETKEFQGVGQNRVLYSAGIRVAVLSSWAGRTRLTSWLEEGGPSIGEGRVCGQGETSARSKDSGTTSAEVKGMSEQTAKSAASHKGEAKKHISSCRTNE
jgi:hypothetical protein